MIFRAIVSPFPITGFQIDRERSDLAAIQHQVVRSDNDTSWKSSETDHGTMTACKYVRLHELVPASF
jgi:hypothetical protein